MNYILNRMLATIPVMLVVAILTFLLIHLSPGDPAAQIAGDSASAADIAKLHASLGLDQPLWQQFFQWAWQITKGNLGTSLFTRMPVSRSEEHTSELQSLMRISYAVFCLKKNTNQPLTYQPNQSTRISCSNTSIPL